MRLPSAVVCALTLVIPSASAAQTPSQPSPAADPGLSWVYGISAGLGHRSMSGTFLATELPIGATAPPSRATASLDLEGGVGLGRRVALLAIYEGGASLKSANGWGTLAAHAALRAWVTNRVWVEGGGGVAELAFRQGSSSTSMTTRWWQPGVEAAGGYDIFQGPTVSMECLVRYSEASFEGLRQQTVSVQIGLLGR